jgi:hypothetical protein
VNSAQGETYESRRVSPSGESVQIIAISPPGAFKKTSVITYSNDA